MKAEQRARGKVKLLLFFTFL